MNNTAIEIKNLSVLFGHFKAVDDVSFTIKKGEIFGFLGANGAGKTTTIRVMCGLLAPSHGTVKVAGLDFTHGANAIKRKVGYMSQKFTLYDDLTVQENIDFKASLRQMEPEDARRRAKELFDFIEFTYPGTTLVADLPSGVKQQVSLAATLLHDPEIIFLDEPTSGVSPGVRAKFWKLIDSLAAQNKTLIVTTHYMDEAEQCGRIALMRAGRLIALDSPENLKKHAYPEGLVEIRCDRDVPKECLTVLRKEQKLVGIWPFGMKYHAVPAKGFPVAQLQKELPAGFAVRAILPSMEDVFIRLVEGVER